MNGLTHPVLKKLVFLGTGTSSQVPVISCLTDPNPTCETCLSGRSPDSKNRRRNTSLLAVFEHPDGRQRNIVFDCGKSFYDSVITFFPKHEIRKVDAVVLTHDHADAMLGLDDIRMFTLHGSVQEEVRVYLDERTMESVQRVFPYIVNIAKATGGGDVPSVDFQVFNLDTGFEIDGIPFRPMKVWHGKNYESLGFRFDNVAYISDLSHIPDEAASHLEGCDVIILDALGYREHISHLSIDQAVKQLYRFRPKYGFLTGFAHKVNHDVLNEEMKQLDGDVIIRPAYDGLTVSFPLSPSTMDL